MKSKAEVERILAWRSDDFGHNTQSLLEAESQALQEIGNDYLILEKKLAVAIEALERIPEVGEFYAHDIAIRALAQLRGEE